MSKPENTWSCARGRRHAAYVLVRPALGRLVAGALASHLFICISKPIFAAACLGSLDFEEGGGVR